MGLLEYIQRKVHGGAAWPPPEVAEHWDRIRDYRRRFRNDPAEMLQYTPRMNMHPHRREIYTPVPLAREIARYSAALLFSSPPKIVFEENAELLARVLEANGLEPLLQSAAERVAIEGRGALRVIWDDAIAPEPYLTYIPEDQVIWDIRHGRAVIGGTVVIEHRPADSDVVYRLLEEHGTEDGRGYIRRTLYRGTGWDLGQPAALGEVPEFAELEDEEWTGLDAPTLIMWENVPGSYSDLAGLDVLLDRLDEAESYLVDKIRKSVPRVFADRSLAGENGEVDLEGVILTGDENMELPMGESAVKTVETAQPELQSEEHVRAIDHLREIILTCAGYSQSSWGLGEQGRSDSGTAIKLRMARTLLTRAGKERMASEAIRNALAVALAWSDGEGAERSVRDFRPQVMLGDGLPRDMVELAQSLSTRRAAGVVSLYQAVREQHPDWDEESVNLEVERIRAEDAPAVDSIARSLNLEG